jgi:hypothetical protein
MWMHNIHNDATLYHFGRPMVTINRRISCFFLVDFSNIEYTEDAIVQIVFYISNNG